MLLVSFSYVYTYSHLPVKDGGSSKVDKFLVSIAITLGVVFVLYCLNVRFLSSLKRFLNTKKLREEDPEPSKIRKILNKLVIMISKDSLDQPNPSIQSIETEHELKRAEPAQFEYTSRSANRIEGSANNLNRLPRWSEIVKETRNDLIAVTSDRGTHYDLLPFETETSEIIEKERRTKKRSVTSIPRQILSVEEQTNRLRKPKERSSSKNTQAPLSNTIFKRSDFEDNRFKKLDEIEIQNDISDGTIYETNSEGEDGEVSNKDKVVTLDSIIRTYETDSVSK